jgi:hypothetical protein
MKILPYSTQYKKDSYGVRRGGRLATPSRFASLGVINICPPRDRKTIT